jgi:hypothetical protein
VRPLRRWRRRPPGRPPPHADDGVSRKRRSRRGTHVDDFYGAEGDGSGFPCDPKILGLSMGRHTNTRGRSSYSGTCAEVLEFPQIYSPSTRPAGTLSPYPRPNKTRPEPIYGPFWYRLVEISTRVFQGHSDGGICPVEIVDTGEESARRCPHQILGACIPTSYL